MPQINSLKKQLTNVSIFTKILTDDIFNDMRFVQLMNLLIQSDNLHNFTYCFYCDHSSLRTNIFVPVFHTIYLGCQKNNVLLGNHEDLWITNIFKQNNYYVLSNKDDPFDYHAHKVSRINNIKEIDGVI